MGSLREDWSNAAPPRVDAGTFLGSPLRRSADGQARPAYNIVSLGRGSLVLQIMGAVEGRTARMMNSKCQAHAHRFPPTLPARGAAGILFPAAPPEGDPHG